MRALSKRFSYSILALCFSVFASCEEFIEPSLDRKSVVLLAPANGHESADYQQAFWWTGQQDALQYRLQIVSPRFDAIAKLIIDTVVLGDKFVHTLDPGEYQWRVRPENGSSNGSFKISSFRIFASSITSQQVQIKAPAKGFLTSQANVNFTWLKLYGAENYRLQVDDKSFIDEQDLILDIVTDNLEFIHKVQEEGLYQWRVRAETAETTSKWSVVNTFTYDGTPPAKVLLRTPVNNQQASKPVKLVWDSLSDAATYELYLYANEASIPMEGFPKILTTSTYTLNDGEPGEKITWRVRAVDKAGNKGSFSNDFSFTIQ